MWRRPVEILLLLIVAATIVRAWLVDGLIRPLRIAGPSMSQTWLGPHRQTTCQDCAWQFPTAESLLNKSGLATCPLCGHLENPWRSLPITPGDRLLVDRSAFLWRQPNRWEPIVFHGPEFSAGMRIKRVVGLPGERVELSEGDVYINGAIARKPLSVARSFNLVVHDSRYRPRSGKSQWNWSPEELAERNGPAREPRWQACEQGYQRQAANPGTAGQEESAVQWLAFTRSNRSTSSSEEVAPPHSHAIHDNYAVNQNVSRSLNRVEDVMATARLRTTGNGSLRLRVLRRPHVYEFQIDATSSQIELFRDGSLIDSTDSQSESLDNITLDWGTIDRQILLAVDDQVVMRHTIEDSARDANDPAREERDIDQLNSEQDWTTIPPLAIGATTLGVTIERIRVWRDVHYLTAPVGFSPALASDHYDVAERTWFVLGDNSPVSLDSRTEACGLVAADSLVGRPLLGR